MRRVAAAADATGPFDAVIHNAGIGYREPRRVETDDGLEHVLAVNVLAPYLLTALIDPPARLVYLSSGMHRGGQADLSDPQWARRRWDGAQAYSDSKLLDVVLAFAVARRWPGALSNALEPGWVATKMGGAGAPDDLSLAPVTQAWLAVSDDPAATGTAGYFYHQAPRQMHPAARDAAFQDELLDYCAALTGGRCPPTARWPASPGQRRLEPRLNRVTSSAKAAMSRSSQSASRSARRSRTACAAASRCCLPAAVRVSA